MLVKVRVRIGKKVGYMEAYGIAIERPENTSFPNSRPTRL